INSVTIIAFIVNANILEYGYPHSNLKIGRPGIGNGGWEEVYKYKMLAAAYFPICFPKQI
ncbi:MAG: hypothetical protein ACRD8W_30745, partial [Nitrososphaeraceae archaeon]